MGTNSTLQAHWAHGGITQEITDNWHPLHIDRGTRTVSGKRNKELSSIFQPPEEGRSVQRPKRCNKHGYKDKDNSPKNVINVHNTSSHNYRQKS